jgi:hypothetical protein
MPGLDPGIHPSEEFFAKEMDCRVKPGNDDILLRRHNRNTQISWGMTACQGRYPVAKRPLLQFRRRGIVEDVALGAVD